MKNSLNIAIFSFTSPVHLTQHSSYNISVNTDQNSLQSIIKQKPYLMWYSPKDNISEKSSFEAIINYGDWVDFLNALKTVGYNEARSLYTQIRDSKRQNLQIKTANYFDLFFKLKNIKK